MIPLIFAVVVVGVITGVYAVERLFDWLAELGKSR